jgi:hypothetical protein
MERITNHPTFKAVWPTVKKRWFFGFVALFYLFFCWFYMGPSFTHCTDQIYGFGDSTGGPIWSNSIKPSVPLLGGQEYATNYPVGDNLYSPVNFATVAQTVIIKTTSKIVGPVCGYNMVNILGYMTTGLTMFAFIYYLTRKRWIALVAGYAVAFTPYVQSKIGGHPSYGFASLLIGIVWLSLHALQKRSLKHGIFLALLLAFCVYFDPYFTLLAGTVAAPIFAVWGLTALNSWLRYRSRRPRIIEMLKILAISGGVFVFAIIPVAFVRIHDAAAINSSTSAVRGDVNATAMLCSSYPIDYLLPDARNYFLLDLFGPNYTYKNISHRHWCGFGESRVTISLTILATVALSFIIFGWERLNRRRLKLHKDLAYNPKLLIGSVAAIAFLAFLLSMPPRIRGVATLTAVVLKLTSTWRIFAREYLAINMSVVMLFAIALTYFSRVTFKWSKYVMPGMLVVLFVAILCEYQIQAPFLPLTFSYSKDSPGIYKQIRDDKDIKVIAEYPLDRIGVESDSIVYYLTMQTVHQKKLFNSAIAENSRENMQLTLKDLTDPQTLEALRYFGIHYVVIHGSTEQYISSKTDQLQIIGHDVPPIYSLIMVHIGGTSDDVLAKIKDGPTTDHVLTIPNGFVVNQSIMTTPLDSDYETVQNTTLKLVPLSGKSKPDAMPACFEAKMSGVGDTGNLTISVAGKPVQTLPLTDSYTPIQVMATEAQTIQLHTDNGHNVRLNNLGCGS